jgi:hypothetical protein
MGLSWQPISSLENQFSANLDAMKLTHPLVVEQLRGCAPTMAYSFVAEPGMLRLGKMGANGIEQLPNPLPPMSARDVVRKICPSGKCGEPLMVAGLDQGWLWDAIARLECSTSSTPGHRPPLYFLARDIERLWVVLHVHDWTTIFNDPRVQLFVGADAVEQCRTSMIANPNLPWSKLCVTVDSAIWPAGVSVDSLWQAAHQAANERMRMLTADVESLYAGLDAKTIARSIRGQHLRVMGITSRFTTFLKHSMADWLEAFDAMGHETRTIIEQADHEVLNPLAFAEEITNFKPDLLLLIDHYRGEITGLPRQIPCVMWVQDQLPNIFSTRAGAAQGPRDYCVGFGRLELRDRCGYPESRFLPAPVGVNQNRFRPRELSKSEMEKYGCDMSFVSHASAPATVLLSEQLRQTDEMGRKLLLDVFEQMRAIYDDGKAIGHASFIRRAINAATLRLRVNLDAPSQQSLFDFFNQKINNALFRHQALTWAADLGINLHLYGRGWEQHPRFRQYARGIACNQNELATIYQASKINLQLTPTGAVHQRLLDGLSAGGFFLMRYCPGDLADRIHQPMWEWCQQRNITSHEQFLEQADDQVTNWLREFAQLMGVELTSYAMDIVAHLRLSADSGFARSAGSIWPEYDEINFDSPEILAQLANRFLTNDAARREITASMRDVVNRRFTYRAISEQMLEMIADDLAERPMAMGVAA